MIQWLIVGALVLASASYALWSLLPARARLRALDTFAGRSPQAGWAQALRRRTLAELAGGCGSCAANGDADAPGATPPRKSP